MSRLKFRIFSKDTNEYLIGEFLVGGDGTMIHNAVSYESFLNTGRHIVEQYTGFRDNNDNMIYENDIIKSPNNSNELVVCRDITGLWCCKENREHGMWELSLYDLVHSYGVEIVGNVHKQKDAK